MRVYVCVSIIPQGHNFGLTHYYSSDVEFHGEVMLSAWAEPIPKNEIEGNGVMRMGNTISSNYIEMILYSIDCGNGRETAGDQVFRPNRSRLGDWPLSKAIKEKQIYFAPKRPGMYFVYENGYICFTCRNLICTCAYEGSNQ